MAKKGSEKKFVEFLESAGFEIKETFPDWYSRIWEVDDQTVLRDSRKNEIVSYVFPSGRQGYSGFFAAFDFDTTTGEFKEHCCGE